MIRTVVYKSPDNLGFLKREKDSADVGEVVSEIIRDVRQNGDEALFKYCRKFDGAELSSLNVTAAEMDEAFRQLDDGLIEIIKESAENIRAFHSRQITNGFIINEKNGVVIGQKVLPLRRVGLYVPGGTASYPSSVLMNCIPAKLAGCDEIIMTTPPSRDGSVNPAILAAARLAGVDRIFKTGGAQSVAALAYGTESVPRVDKIVGPGNRYVAEAKRQVFGLVDIDMIAGPSEILVIADGTCRADVIAADMLSQAEHDRLASAILLTDSEALASAVSDEIEHQLALLPRYEIARASIDNYGAIIIVPSLERAVEISNDIAPEHLELCVDNPFDYLDKVKNAGSVFLGKNCPEALGDYFAGPNHTLPTSGTARFSSPLSVEDFVKRTQFTYYTSDALSLVCGKVAAFAEAEGLTAHARSATIRFDKG
jgi:histidinol dehydrogenase